MLWPITRRGLVAVAAAFFAAMSPVPAAAQIPTSPGQRLAPTNENEQHLSDVSVEAANALGAAQAAAAHCDAKGLADAVKQLQQLEQEAASAANIAKGAGAMSLVRPEFANSIHDTIAGELKTASGLKPNCPQPNQPQAQVPGGNANPPPPPPPPPVGGFLGPKPQQVGPPNPIDDLYNQADDAVDAYWAAFDHCDKDGMKRALDRLRDIAKQAHQMHRAAEKAGKFGGLSKSDSEDLMDLEDDIADFIYESQFDVPKCPVPQAVPGTGSNCPAPTPGTPRESLLNQPLPWKPDLRIVPRLTYSLYSHAILDYHNTLRAEFGSPPLQWNSTLAAHALDYARTMTETGQLVHAPRAGRENERENLSLSVHGANSI
ncbi:MAG: CAP domain-containing protein, partial [Tepidisphaeraceae bacterium]